MQSIGSLSTKHNEHIALMRTIHENRLSAWELQASPVQHAGQSLI